MSVLSGGIFSATDANDEDAELRALVDDLARRSYNGSLGRREVPDHLDTELWRALEETGLARLSTTPDSEAGPRELAVVLYGLARHACAAPVAETDGLTGWLAQRIDLDLPNGPSTVALVSAEADGNRIRGTATQVPWARESTVVVAVRGDNKLRVAKLDTDDVTLHPAHNLAGEPRDTLSFDMPLDSMLDVSASVADELATRGAWSRCVQIIGALDAAAALTVEHTRQRLQFGRSLSSFQSVQQSLASIAGDIERARAAVEIAIAAADEYGFDSSYAVHAVAVAKVTVGRAVGPVTTVAHQLHGAIGVTREHPLWLFTLRAQSWVGDYGNTNQHARRLGRSTLEADDPWTFITG